MCSCVDVGAGAIILAHHRMTRALHTLATENSTDANGYDLNSEWSYHPNSQYSAAACLSAIHPDIELRSALQAKHALSKYHRPIKLPGTKYC